MYDINDSHNFFTNELVLKLLAVFTNLYKVNIRNISITNLSLDEMLKFNKKVLDHDYYTDVITFCTSKKNFIDVEIFLCLDYVDQFCKDSKNSLEYEYVRTFYHALLHCVGFNDTNDIDKDIMRKKEKELTDLFYTFHVKH